MMTNKFLFYCLIKIAICFDMDDEFTVEWQLTYYDIQDLVEDISLSTKDALLHNNFTSKMQAEEDLSELIFQKSKQFSVFEGIPDKYFKQWRLIMKPGNYLLDTHERSALVHFSNLYEEVAHTVQLNCSYELSTFGKKDIMKALESNRDFFILQNVWSCWQQVFLPMETEFRTTVHLTTKAQNLNGLESIESYWEMLSEYEDGYTLAYSLWEEVEPLYEKLHAFVKARIENYYNINNNSTEIPIYLLGSLSGTDWINVADIILPQPDFFLQGTNRFKQMSSESIFHFADNIIAKLGLKRFNEEFWKKSVFNHTTCDIHLLLYPSQERTEVLTCSEINWQQYLDIHRTTMETALRNHDYSSCVYSDLRQPILDEALVEMVSLLALNSIQHNGIVNSIKYSEGDMMLLLLTALSVLPKIPYYLALDSWRIQTIEEQIDDFGTIWENARCKLQKVKGANNRQYDFLDAKQIKRNLPYLSKFLGIFLQFQIMDHYRTYDYLGNATILDAIHEDPFFLEMITARQQYDTRTVMSTYFNIEDISAASLLNYFQPLEDYLLTAPTNVTYHLIENTVFTTDSVIQHINSSAKINEHTNKTVTNKQNDIPRSKTSMYLGIVVLAGFVLIAIGGIVRKSLKEKRRANNRRYQS